MKKIIFLSMSFYFLFIGNLYAQIDEKNLFYCHEYINLRSIKILDNNFKVTFSYDLKNIYLLNEENIIIDTINVGKESDYLIQGIEVVNERYFLFNALNKIGSVEIKDGKFLVDEERINYQDKPYFGLIKLDNGYLGWGKIKAKKGHIDYQFYHIEDDKITEIFPSNMKVTTKYNGSGQILSNKYINYDNNKVYIPVESASAVVIYDFKSNESFTFNFPEINNKKESWYYYFDKKKSRHYALLIRRNELNELYLINNFETLKFINEIEFVPNSIYNEHLQTSSIQKENNKMICHYLIPIY